MTAIARRATKGQGRARSRGAVLRLPVQILAENAGIPTSTVTSYELGRKDMPQTAEQKLVVAIHVGLRQALRAAGVAEEVGLTRPAPRLRKVA